MRLLSLALLLVVAAAVVADDQPDPPSADPAPVGDPVPPTPDVPPTDAKADLFAKLDKDGNGRIQLDELPAELRQRLAPLFTRLGKTEITKEELDAVGKTDGAADGNDRTKYFDTLNKNGDDVLTVAEAPEAARELVRALLVRAGKDEDGSLTRAEFVAATKGGPATPTVDTPRSSGPGLIKALDTNNDGRLSAEEFAAAATKFAILDADKSGDLDAAELLGSSETTDEPADTPTALRRRIFDSLANGDEWIDRTEAAAEGAERLNENFDSIDDDDDDRISFAEFEAAIDRGAESTAPAASGDE